jgi:hypothetical protein
VAMNRVPLLASVAAAALALGSVGTAEATPLTQHVVKKIANRVVARKAHTLSVAHAVDSTTLAGKPATAYLDRVAQSQIPTSMPRDLVAGVNTEITTTTLAVPAGVNLVHLTGTASYEGTGPSSIVLWITETGADCNDIGNIGYSMRSLGLVTTAGDRQQLTTDFVAQLVPGAHLFRLCAFMGGGGKYWQAGLTAETVATGATGGATISRPGPGASGSVDQR